MPKFKVGDRVDVDGYTTPNDKRKECMLRVAVQYIVLAMVAL